MCPRIPAGLRTHGGLGTMTRVMTPIRSLPRLGLAAVAFVIAAASAALATTAPTVPIPEPGLWVLVGSGVASAVLYARNRRR
jgi:hypothetical protein